ncbi:uncharacterized protein LOC129228332 [Uloborus diversus]|uniref:uncharacterized protein LOC129228332 n=1 Tax=Uloborus diversus TaxID=327109 RepID=UPI00240A8DAD|nr:uncharacterized protein LOC129228332 [Uloborus diversus]
MRPDSWTPIRIAETSEEVILPRFNPPTNPAVQMAVHSPYFLPSPYLEGTTYQGGRAYELRLNMEESHLLPTPYQTNCTDYMLIWKQRGGEAPIDQMGIIQECRVNSSYKNAGCIPVTIDYPHTYNVCKTDVEDHNNVSDDGCTLLADIYNQPCE